MNALDELVIHLVDIFAGHAPDRSQGAVQVTSLDLDLPLEARFASDGKLLATLPRGLMATGFERPLGRLRLHCGEAA
jgi:hypothetical protein